MATTSAPAGNFASSAPARAASLPQASLVSLFPLALLFYSALIPQEVRFEIVGLNIYPPRMASFLILPWLLQCVAVGNFPFRKADMLVILACIWMIVSFSAYYGIGDGLLRGTPLAFDVLVPYLAARQCIRSTNDFRRLLVLIAPGSFLVGGFLALESVTHVPLLKPLAASIFGPLPVYESGQSLGYSRTFEDFRFGLLRAAGPFSHPILGGMFLASLLPLYLTSGLRGWPKYTGMAAGLLSIFSISTGAFLVLIIGLGLIAYDRIQTWVDFLSWRLFFWGLGLAGLLLQFASQNGLVPVLIRFTFNPSTGYYRQLIWEFGSASVAKHPWIGIGFTDYERLPWMVPSIDNHWLLLAIRHGFTTALLMIAAAIAAICYVAIQSSRSSNLDRSLLFGLCAATTALVIAGFSVAFFGGIQTWVFVIIGICMSLGAKSPATSPARSAPVQHINFAPQMAADKNPK